MSRHDPDQSAAEKKLLTESRELFDRSSQRVVVADGNRLRLMRRQALAADKPVQRRWLLPAGAAACTLLAAGLAWWSQGPIPRAGEPIQEPSDLAEAVLAADNDAQAYAWLGEAPVALDAAKDESL